MVEKPKTPEQFPGKEMLNERINWLAKYNYTEGVRLWAQAAAEADYTDAIDFVRNDLGRQKAVANLFNTTPVVLFDPQYCDEETFIKKIEDTPA